MQPEDQTEQRVLNKKLFELAQRRGLQTLAAGDCHYVHESDREAHEVMLSIQTHHKITDPNRYSFGDCRVHMRTEAEMIAQTQKWILDVVIGANFCPFAAKEYRNNKIHFQFAKEGNIGSGIKAFINECIRLDEHNEIETTLLIFPYNYSLFADYLKLLNKAEKELMRQGYEGIYQLASFHPLYCFQGAAETDAANYTNRSIYPMLHIIREESMEIALEKYPDPEGIPERNIIYAREKGLNYMKTLREQCI